MYSSKTFQATSFAHGRLPLDTEIIESLITPDMTRNRKCARCHQTYQEWKNIGAWRCSEHPQLWDDSRRIYTCCETASTTGCQACDHTEDIVTPYPGCNTDHRVLLGNAAFELCAGNLKELESVHKEAQQYPPDFEEQTRQLGPDLAKLFIYRRCLYGRPSPTPDP